MAFVLFIFGMVSPLFTDYDKQFKMQLYTNGSVQESNIIYHIKQEPFSYKPLTVASSTFCMRFFSYIDSVAPKCIGSFQIDQIQVVIVNTDNDEISISGLYVTQHNDIQFVFKQTYKVASSKQSTNKSSWVDPTSTEPNKYILCVDLKFLDRKATSTWGSGLSVYIRSEQFGSVMKLKVVEDDIDSLLILKHKVMLAAYKRLAKLSGFRVTVSLSCSPDLVTKLINAWGSQLALLKPFSGYFVDVNLYLNDVNEAGFSVYDFIAEVSCTNNKQSVLNLNKILSDMQVSDSALEVFTGGTKRCHGPCTYSFKNFKSALPKTCSSRQIENVHACQMKCWKTYPIQQDNLNHVDKATALSHTRFCINCLVYFVKCPVTQLLQEFLGLRKVGLNKLFSKLELHLSLLMNSSYTSNIPNTFILPNLPKSDYSNSTNEIRDKKYIANTIPKQCVQQNMKIDKATLDDLNIHPKDVMLCQKFVEVYLCIEDSIGRDNLRTLYLRNNSWLREGRGWVYNSWLRTVEATMTCPLYEVHFCQYHYNRTPVMSKSCEMLSNISLELGWFNKSQLGKNTDFKLWIPETINPTFYTSPTAYTTSRDSLGSLFTTVNSTTSMTLPPDHITVLYICIGALSCVIFIIFMVFVALKCKSCREPDQIMFISGRYEDDDPLAHSLNRGFGGVEEPALKQNPFYTGGSVNSSVNLPVNPSYSNSSGYFLSGTFRQDSMSTYNAPINSRIPLCPVSEESSAFPLLPETQQSDRRSMYVECHPVSEAEEIFPIPEIPASTRRISTFDNPIFVASMGDVNIDE